MVAASALLLLLVESGCDESLKPAAAAIEYLRRIPDKDADDAAYINLGMTYSRLGQFEKARRAYFQAIDKHSGNIEAYFRVGFDYATAGEPRKAIPWLFRAEELSSGRP